MSILIIVAILLFATLHTWIHHEEVLSESGKQLFKQYQKKH